jgi:lipoprotein-anchoring transpeptidase ErfK/SrfK
MSAELNQIREVIQNARQALRRGDHEETRRWAEQAARLAPELEDPWLLLAAVSNPEESMKYARRALSINPASRRAHKAVEWAAKRAGGEPPSEASLEPAVPSRSFASEAAAPAAVKHFPREGKSPSRLVPILMLAGLVCAVLAFAAWSVSKSSAMASIVRQVQGPPPTSTVESNFAAANIFKPSYTPDWTNTPTQTSTPRYTFTPRFTFTPRETSTLEYTSTPLATDTPTATEMPGVMEAAIVIDTPTSIAPTQKATTNYGGGNGAHWIDINLSEQMLYAYEGDVLVNSFLVSTGVAATPTVTGSYKMYARYLYADMHGPGYFLPDVPYVMYFYKSYGIHGTYWHNNFGTPMSHGCVNMSIPDSGWIFNWSTFGTKVVVHY